jgi:hypothetical protein
VKCGSATVNSDAVPFFVGALFAARTAALVCWAVCVSRLTPLTHKAGCSPVLPLSENQKRRGGRNKKDR